jgi:cation:H+ antiporter
MALGGILGSVTFNLCILVFIDLIDPEPIYSRLAFAHIGTGLLSCMLLGLVIVGIALGHAGLWGPDGVGLGHVGITSISILGFYLLGQYALFRMAKGNYAQPQRMKLRTLLDRWPLRHILLVYGGLAIVILVAAVNLGIAAEALAARYHLGATFAGATLLGIVTSLPEITNAIACARQREHDLAVGNILGANAMVLSVLFVADLCYVHGRLFHVIGQTEAISSIAMAGLAIVMLGVAIGALAVRSADRVWRVGIASVLLAGLYALSLVIAYHFSALAPAGPS